MTQKKALITGITGQDGSYLAELLLEKGYEVHGILRRSSSFNTGRIDHILPQLHLVYGDLTDSGAIAETISTVRPDEVYNLGAQSHVRVSFDSPRYTADVDAIGALNLLQAVKAIKPDTRVYQASSSELYGRVWEVPQTETTTFYPRSPYGVAKQFAYWMAVNYRESYGTFASNGILFNHESPRREEKPSSAERSPKPQPELSSDISKNLSWATSMQSVIGDTLRSTWNACGESSNTIDQTTLLSQLEKPTRLENSSILPLGILAWSGKSTLESTLDIIGQRK